jgi:Domain of unknown function (DUF1851)
MGVRDWFNKRRRDDDTSSPIAVDLAAFSRGTGLLHLLADVSEADVVRAVEGWLWLPLSGFTVIAVSAFGEPFLRDSMGTVLQIDTIEGKLSRIANCLPELAAMLKTEEARDQLLFEGLVMGARHKGLTLAKGECYDFRIAPILGGQMDADHIEKLSFVVKLHIAGQIHEQVKDLARGTKINSVKLSG